MRGTSLSSSVIVASALGYKPDGVAAKENGVCSFCGLHIEKGDLASPFSVSAAFMDDVSLAAKGSGLTCGHCAPLMSATALRETGYGVFTMGGVQPFRKWIDIANAIKNPPNEPFVMTYATANNQHMAWRAPVNFSSDLFYVRVGLRNLKIRHAYLMKAIDVCQVVGSAFGREATDKTLAHPFVRLSSDLKEIGHAGLVVNFKPAKVEAADYQNLLSHHKDNIDFLMNLTLGETWALRFLLTPGASTT